MGVIAAPHGIRGEVKVKSYAAKPEDLFAYGVIYVAERTPCKLKLQRVIGPDMLIASIEGVTTRNDAETFRGAYLYVERAQLPSLADNDEFYYHDLEGLEVKTIENVSIGTVRAVNNYGGGDFLDIITVENSLLTLPFTKEAVLEVKLRDKVILINPDFLFG